MPESNVEEIQKRIELKKAIIELAKIKQPIYKKIEFWSAFTPVLLSIVGLIAAFKSNLFDLVKKESELRKLQLDFDILQKNAELLQAKDKLKIVQSEQERIIKEKEILSLDVKNKTITIAKLNNIITSEKKQVQVVGFDYILERQLEKIKSSMFRGLDLAKENRTIFDNIEINTHEKLNKINQYLSKPEYLIKDKLTQIEGAEFLESIKFNFIKQNDRWEYSRQLLSNLKASIDQGRFESAIEIFNYSISSKNIHNFNFHEFIPIIIKINQSDNLGSKEALFEFLTDHMLNHLQNYTQCDKEFIIQSFLYILRHSNQRKRTHPALFIIPESFFYLLGKYSLENGNLSFYYAPMYKKLYKTESILNYIESNKLPSPNEEYDHKNPRNTQEWWKTWYEKYEFSIEWEDSDSIENFVRNNPPGFLIN